MQQSRNTIQRQMVLDAVFSLTCHPTAEEVFLRISRENTSISKATVYRNLNFLAKSGKILRVSHLDAADRFDFNTTPHHHFSCNTCKEVFDVDLPYKKEELIAEIANNNGFLYTGCNITFTGLCNKCQQKHPAKG